METAQLVLEQWCTSPNYHLTGRFCLGFPFWGENRKVCAPLYSAFRIPSALSMPHQHDTL